MHPIEKIISDCDEAIVEENFDALMENYTDDAILVIRPGINAVGKREVRTAFERIATYFQHGLVVEQAGMHVLEAGSTALVLAKTIIKST